MSELQQAKIRRQGIQQNYQSHADEAKRLRTIVGNFDREAEGVKDKPDLVAALATKAQPFKNRLATIEPNLEKMKQQMVDLDLQIAAMEKMPS